MSDLDRFLRKKQEEDKDSKTIDADAKNEEEGFGKELKQKIINRYMKQVEERTGRRLKRKERREFNRMEKEDFKERQNNILILAIIGIFSLFFIYMYIQVEWVLVIVVMYGVFICIPIGMFLGFIFIDPWYRCKIMRKMTKRNYGIVFFVSKANKIVSKIKDFDAGLIWKKNECWILTKGAVYQLSKDSDQLVEKGKIESDKIVSLVETVPVLFVDLDSMEPLSLIAGKEPIRPEEIGANLKSWADNQLAKALFIRKSLDMYFIIVIIASIASAAIGFMALTKIDELNTKIDTIKAMLEEVLQYVSRP